VLLPARSLARARQFYERLLGIEGREVAAGRIYFPCGGVILGVLDSSGGYRDRWSSPTEAIYFAVDDLRGFYRRALRLGCLDPGLLHGDPTSPLGKVVVRPWGERSFYVVDPSGNSLCFVDSRTLFTGRSAQIGALRRAGQG